MISLKKKGALSFVVILFISNIIVFFQLYSNSASEITILSDENTLQFSASNAYEIIENQLSYGNRIPGSTGSENCGNYFKTHINSISSTITFIEHTFQVKTVDCKNYLIKINPNEEHIIILGAHYDSRAVSEKDIEGSKRDDPCPGANDGGSGVAVLLDLCRVFFEERDNLNCSIWILLFDAEDQGLSQGAYGISGWDWCEGSYAFVEDIGDYYDSTTQTIDAMILLDMVGGTNLRFIKESYSNLELLNNLFETGRDLGYLDTFPYYPVTNAIIDDHLPFIDVGIPSADLIIQFWNAPSAWPYHHTTSDTLEHISNESLNITGTTVEEFIYDHYLTSVNTSDGTQDNDWRNSGDPLAQSMQDAFYFIIIAVIIVSIVGVSIYFILRRGKRIAFKMEAKL